MDKDAEVIANFETMLRKQRTRQLLGLYRDEKLPNITLNKAADPREVLANLSKQIRDIQNADSFMSDKKPSRSISKCVKSSFLPVYMLPRSAETHNQIPSAKFDTQGVSDTQLIKIVQDVDAIDSGGITQEFDTTFQHENSEKEDEPNIKPQFPIIDISLKEPDLNKNIDDIKSTDILPEDTNNRDNVTWTTESNNDLKINDEIVNDRCKDVFIKNNKQNDIESKNSDITDDMTIKQDNYTNDIETNCTQFFNESIEKENDQLNVFIHEDSREDSCIPLSPIFKSKKSKIPLVFSLEAFENFELVALPAIEESPNIEIVKQIINSQIMGKELNIVSDKKPSLNLLYLDIEANVKDRTSPAIPFKGDELKVERHEELLKIPIQTKGNPNGNLLEDEILFSSDEEENEVVKTVDLPLTCALETSFYDQENVLDKTMFVGFQTASNKSIQICSDSFSKAMDILEVDDIPLKNLVKMCDSNVEKTCDDNILKLEDIMDEDDSMLVKSQILSAPKPNSSKRNQNKAVINDQLNTDLNEDIEIIQSQILPSSSIRSRKQNKIETNKDIETRTITAKEFKTKENKSVTNFDKIESDFITEKKSVTPVKRNYQDITPSSPTLKGFKTASNKKIRVSDKAFARSKELFKDISYLAEEYVHSPKSVKKAVDNNKNITNSIAEDFGNAFKNFAVDRNKIDDLQNEKVLVVNKEQALEDPNIINEFNEEMDTSNSIDSNDVDACVSYNTNKQSEVHCLGFKTASNKDINISDSAFSKGEAILHDLLDDNFTAIKKHNHKTEKECDNSINHDGRDARTKYDQNIPDTLNTKDISNKFPSFKTANNKEILISNDALLKTAKVFKDIDQETTLLSKAKTYPIFETNNNERSESADFNTTILNEFEKEIFEEEPPFFGFGKSGKEVKIVENAVSSFGVSEKTIKENYLVDCDIEQANDKVNIPLKRQLDNISKVQEVIREFCNKNDQSTKFKGFQTASKKPVEISAAALAKSKKIPEDIDICFADTNKKFQGFQTASNKPVKISAKALAKSKKIFENIDLSDDKNNETTSHENDHFKLPHIPKNKPLYPKTFEESNKAIKLSHDALSRSKAIIQDIDTVNAEETKAYPPMNTATATNKNVKNLDEALAKSEQLFDALKNMPTDSAFAGFRTASNKRVKVSELALVRSKQVFQDMDICGLERMPQNTKFAGFKTASNKNVKISEEALSKSIRIFQDIDTEGLKIITTNSEFAGFKTASNKDVKISEDAVARSKQLFQDIDTEGLKKITTNSGFAGFKTATNKDVNISESALAKSKHLFKDIDAGALENISTNSGFAGFKTASNKQLNISEDAIAKSKQLFQDIDIGGLENISTNSGFVGFKTASNKQMKISDEALAKGKQLFQDLNVGGLEKISTNIGFAEFKTASNKDVKISEEALLKSRRIFQDTDTEGLIKVATNSGYVGFKTASNKNVKISESALAESKQLFKDIVDGVLENVSTNSGFSGFQTACNKRVKISEDAIARSKQLFQDIDTEGLKKITTNSGFVGFKTASNKDVKISEDAIARSKHLFKDIDTGGVENISADTGFAGFKTASNKDVKISEEALSKSKRLFQDIDTEGLKKITANSGFTGFKTASDKDVKISEDAIARSKKLFQDIDTVDLENICTNSGFVGFKTASNRDVNISKDALAKSKQLFEDIDTTVLENVPTNSGFTGFKTASNKDVKISEDALAKSKQLFKDIDTDLENITKDSGFKTASNKDVNISDEAFAKSKQLFKDIDTGDLENINTNSGFAGFKTASKKDVKISEEALAKSKQLFEDIATTVLENVPTNSGFTGFKTASNKNVKICEEAIAKSKRLFEDIINEAPYPKSIQTPALANKKDIDDIKSRKPTFQFETANNKKVDISKVALTESKRLLEDIVHPIVHRSDLEYKERSLHNIVDKSVAENVDSFIDTQVINNFEQTLHTEDFLKEVTPKRSKRSGSPILSCPKAKKRKKFEIPYSQKVVENITSPQNELLENINKITQLNENYKKNTIYTLKDLHNIEINSDTNPEIDNYILNFTYNNLLDFKFFGKRNDISNTVMTIEDLKDYFLAIVNKKLIPEGWLNIQLKLILWKLISYEIRFPKTMSGVTTVKNVLEQLKHRYNRELYIAERPALRKILEKDDTSSKTLVLCIVEVLADGIGVTSIPPNHKTLELVLTDGWYCIKATTDRFLAKCVSAGRLYVGCKIVTNGAELVGCEQGVSPWEDTSSIRLKIFGNSTRRARWDARLGYHSAPAILSTLSSVMADGGKISKLRLYVTRVYPALYVEKFDDGSTVTRSERLENLHQMKYETERQALMEKLYEEVEKEMSDQESQDSDSIEPGSKRKLNSGSQIAKVMKRTNDPEFANHLTASQTLLLQDHSTRERERILQNIQTRVQHKLVKLGIQEKRNIIPLLKARVIGVDERNNIKISKALLSIWKPNDAVLEIIKEGAWIDVLNVIPTAVRYSEIQLSAGRHSVFSQSKYKENEKIKRCLEPMKRKCHHTKNIVENPSMAVEYNEIDTVGFIFQIDPTMKEFDSKKHQFQNVYLTDAEKNIICANFWGGIKKFGFENVLDTGQVISCTNLQKRAGNTRKSIPQFRVTEFSYFTKTPKLEIARTMMEDLSKALLSIDKSKYIEDCINLRQNFAVYKLQGNENVSPYRIPNIDINSTRNRMFVDSPLAQKTTDENLNLTGLDFESTFKQTETQELSPRTLLRKQQIKEKIAKLKMYGEPPPLSPMQIMNQSKNAGNAFKSPFSKSDVSNSVTSEKNKNLQDLSETSDVLIQNSPVMNRTYVKRTVHPVKINFNKAEEINVNDEFAEEFDGSPPLSLE